MHRFSFLRCSVFVLVVCFCFASSALAYTPRWFNKPNIIPETETESSVSMDGEDQIHIALEPGVTFVYEGEFDGWREERL